ncbi:VWA domain-containing protein [Taibaiella chishuiensis]|uniref:Ca-activated chloride channel family protein n=1 Tax=Taibaiella chishuiensis TaxID=1434707 RepID=A0A2P8DDJ6_9BACT|nr:VWA domain-containing protein [Taibaiella chishuiensis]PSK95247.1 Ca-activated chloride channel family protein [Taibaiella chishuiensis]
MEAHDQITEQFREAVGKSESGAFPGMEEVWDRVTAELDKEEPKKRSALPFYRIGIAAAVLVLLGLGVVMLRQNGEQSLIPALAKQKPESLPGRQSQPQQHPGPASGNTDAVLVQQPAPAIPAKSKTEHPQHPAPVNPSPLVAAQVTPRDTPSFLLKGIVLDENGEAVPGAAVRIDGTNYGTVTDMDGAYELNVKGHNTLTIEAVGYTPWKVKAEPGTAMLTTTLPANYLALNEVGLTTPYGRTMTKEKYVGAADRIEGRLLERMPVSDITKAIERAAPGIQITNGGGQPGSGANIRMRGTGSLSGQPGKGYSANKAGYNNTLNGAGQPASGAAPGLHCQGSAHVNAMLPLYVLDGTIYTGDITRLDPNTIHNITILKEATATALYGSRSVNGVIVITTKNGYEAKQKRRFFQRIKRLFRKQQAPGTTMLQATPEINGQETYNPYVENPFESPVAQPLSTFSIDVDNASYTNIRRFINNGQAVPADAVRIEEMINFFEYKYPQPQGPHPFSITTDYSDAPWNKGHKLLRIGLQGKSILPEQLPASNLVFLVDVSGSMNDPNKLPLLKASMKLLVRQLRPVDRVAIVVYAGAAGLVLPSTPGDHKAEINAALEQLQAGGSTAGGAGIELAYKIAAEHFIKDGNNRVILATDGDFNVGASSDADMQTLIEQKRKTNIFLTCLGYGMGNYKDSKMEVLADKGNGNYAYIDNLQEANRFLVKEFSGTMYSIAKDVKIQVAFNPQYVQDYRLIGYENRRLKAEDFANDAIDAGELGSGHRVTALYEIIPRGVTNVFAQKHAETEKAGGAKAVAAFGDELAGIKFRYKKPDGDKSIEMIQTIDHTPQSLEQASADFKLAAAVAWFGLKLRHSDLVQDTTREAILKLAKAAVASDSQGYKAELVRLVETAL